MDYPRAMSVTRLVSVVAVVVSALSPAAAGAQCPTLDRAATIALLRTSPEELPMPREGEERTTLVELDGAAPRESVVAWATTVPVGHDEFDHWLAVAVLVCRDDAWTLAGAQTWSLRDAPRITHVGLERGVPSRLVRIEVEQTWGGYAPEEPRGTRRSVHLVGLDPESGPSAAFSCVTYEGVAGDDAPLSRRIRHLRRRGTYLTEIRAGGASVTGEWLDGRPDLPPEVCADGEWRR